MASKKGLIAVAVSAVSIFLGCAPTEKRIEFKKPDAVNNEAFKRIERAAPPKVGETFKDCAACPDLVVIPSGSVQMDGKHAVTIGYELAVGKFEVTQKQFMALAKSMAMNNPARFDTCGENCPVEQVHWHTANRYIQKLNERTGLKYRLLSESEWEYAARAGSTAAYGFADDAAKLADYAWFFDNTESTKPVGSKLPNAWGLHDLQGNVEEWVGDCHTVLKNIPADGRKYGGNQCAYFSVRGGSWSHPPAQLALGERGSYGAEYPDSTVGFRVARELE